MKNQLYLFVSVFTFLLLFTSANSAKDEYKVIKVIGEILYKSSGNQMGTGDVFSTETQIKFVTENARAAVISNLKGRFVLAPPSATKKTNLVPAVNSISSRSGAIVNALDFNRHFEGDYLILNKIEVPVSPQNFPQNDKNFFFVSYSYKGEKIMKRLVAGEGNLILDQKEIFVIDGEAIPAFNTEMHLYYRDAGQKENKALSSFHAVFPNQEALRKEVAVILDEYKDATPEIQYEQVKGYINEFYGKPFDPNLKEWMGR
ncbi:MAG TPA: hypothetical protein VFD77_04910 [Brumimicrobium sp.]|nr:hypothetical protein [Brumimicrobium sp.]